MNGISVVNTQVQVSKRTMPCLPKGKYKILTNHVLLAKVSLAINAIELVE